MTHDWKRVYRDMTDTQLLQIQRALRLDRDSGADPAFVFTRLSYIRDLLNGRHVNRRAAMVEEV